MHNESSESDGTQPPGRARWVRRVFDWRVWLGLTITAVSIGWAIRGIPIRDVVDAMEGANFWALLLYSAPFYTASVYVRSLRWRHLTNPIAPIPRPLLFRAESLGFMVNNLLPLRVGEVVRSWTLAQDSGTSTTAIFGTVVLERVLDVVSVLALAGGALAYVGRSSDVGGLLAEGSFLLLPVGAAPLVVLILMRVAPETVIRISHRLMVLLPLSIREKVEALLRSFIEGLGALSGGRHLFWIVFHSLVIWLLLSAAPIWIGFWAFDVEIGSPVETMVASWIVLGAVGVAVALPSAPGFIGPYQLAFKAVLVRFGVEPATALAMGVLVWFAFWLTLTLQGLFFLRRSNRSLAELARHTE